MLPLPFDLILYIWYYCNFYISSWLSSIRYCNFHCQTTAFNSGPALHSKPLWNTNHIIAHFNAPASGKVTLYPLVFNATNNMYSTTYSWHTTHIIFYYTSPCIKQKKWTLVWKYWYCVFLLGISSFWKYSLDNGLPPSLSACRSTWEYPGDILNSFLSQNAFVVWRESFEHPHTKLLLCTEIHQTSFINTTLTLCMSREMIDMIDHSVFNQSRRRTHVE